MRVCDNDHQPGDIIECAFGEPGNDELKATELCRTCMDALLAFDWSTLAKRQVVAAAPAAPQRERQQRKPRRTKEQMATDETALAEQQQQWRDAATKPGDDDEAMAS